MPNLGPGELLQALIDSCHKSTEAVLYVEGHNPYKLSLNGKPFNLFVANVTHARRADPDEFRIQCPGDLPDQLSVGSSSGQVVCILGYHAESGTFSGWDPGLFLTRSRKTQKFSMYTRLSGLLRASTEGFARYVDTEGQIVLLFRSEYLGLYIENASFIHGATDTALRNIVNVYGSTRLGSKPRRRLMVAKHKIEVTHTQYARSPQFRSEVLSAYGYRCAMCGMQLELVEAAHLVPHADPRGLDVIENGVALCALHHKSLDTGLLYIDGDYTIRMNNARHKYLAKIKLTEGLNQYKRYLRSEIALPTDVSKHPLKGNILLGNQLRGIGII